MCFERKYEVIPLHIRCSIDSSGDPCQENSIVNPQDTEEVAFRKGGIHISESGPDCIIFQFRVKV